MTVEEKIAFLNKYTLSSDKKVEFITDKETIKEAPIPELWKQAFLTNSLEERKQLIISKWEKYAAIELRNTILYLKTYLQDIELMKIGEDYSLLYTLLTYQTQKEIFYEGKAPIKVQDLGEVLGMPIESIDSSIINFYTQLHNGFYDFTSKSMGLDSIDNIESLSYYDWEYEEELHIDLNKLYNFFSSGMGSYVVLDLSRSIENGAYIWSARELPKGNLNFWDIVDEWIIIGLDF